MPLSRSLLGAAVPGKVQHLNIVAKSLNHHSLEHPRRQECHNASFNKVVS